MQRASIIVSQPAASRLGASPRCCAPVRGTMPTRRIASARCAANADERQEVLPSMANPLLMSAAAIAAPYLIDVQNAVAAGGEFGLLEGRTAALVHPAVMFFLFASTGYAGYLGWQWRRTREVGEEIRELRKLVPVSAGDSTSAPPAQNATTLQIEAKEKERKELLAGGFKDKHALWGSMILAMGTGIAIEGCVNTYMRTGKLFPGPHLYAGAGMVAIWAIAAALVPEMQKGNNTARTAHIALNGINFLLFASQVPTGLEIVGKVFQFTVWP